ncbi:hypothetical protein P154DRAFT_37434 [Amniculicola lignicola CBS 123094]|uniref:Uncharacterized protein n=1 Tax=Amniculicola lignicola CBS 123094 TaxID=1392246 RepID=A0A6A5WX86_9PLEO|nr:hypothetical protein P154DRAFT_37434 [Amniculicola lignicola CBS 123094]
MHFTAPIIAIAVLFAPLLPAAAAGPPKRLPPCGPTERPCRCPQGTTFKNFTTFGIVGAPAKDIQSIMGPFFDFTYVNGLIPTSTTGKDFKVGATRTFNLSAPGAPFWYETTDVLFRWENSTDGSFSHGFSQIPDPPVVKVPGSGEYHGQWCLIQGQQTMIPNETVVAWKNWRCEVGETFPAVKAHEAGIRNVSAILQKLGKHTGADTPVFTTWYDLRQD